MDYSIIKTTCANKDEAKKLAKMLVKKQYAACVQMIPIDSVYLWDGKMCGNSEIALFIKPKLTFFEEIAHIIKKNHSYEVPEIIQIPIINGLPEYLKWIDS